MAKNIKTKTVSAAPVAATQALSPKYIIGLLLLLSIAVYVKTLSNGYALDDFQAVRDNIHVQEGIKAIPTILSSPYLGGVDNDFYRPLSTVSFAIENSLWGANPALQHLVNMLLFGLSVVLLFKFLNTLFNEKKTTAVLIACLLFAVHPIHTDVVSNIKGRDELLCFIMAIASLFYFLQYSRKAKSIYLAGAIVLYFLSLLSKETSIMLLGILPLSFFVLSPDHKKRSFIICLSGVLVAALFMTLRYWVLKTHDANHSADIPLLMNPLADPTLGFWGRLSAAIYALGYYIRLLLLPYPLVCDYSYNTIPVAPWTNAMVWLSLAVYLGICILAIKRLCKNTKDALAYGILFYLICISLFSNILFLVSGSFAERFAFFASAGFCLAVAATIEALYERFNKSAIPFHKNTLIKVTVIGLCIAYATLSNARNTEWADNYTLFSADAEKAPGNCRLNYFLGTELGKVKYAEETDAAAKAKIADDAALYLQRALCIYKDFAEVHSNLAGVFLLKNQIDSATYHARKAYEMSPKNAGWIRNLAIIYNQNKNYAAALALFKEVNHNNPQTAEWLFNLGQAFFNNNQLDSAAYYETIALHLEPKNGLIIKELARTYFYQKNYEASKALSKTMLLLEPQNADNYIDLSACYITLNQSDSALPHLYKALSMDPNKKRSYEFLSIIYKAKGISDSANKYQNISLGMK